MSYNWLAQPFGYWANRPPAKWRRKLISSCQGKILEIGVGPGTNLPLYSEVESIWAIDKSPAMLKQAEKRTFLHNSPLHLMQMDAQFLEFPDNSFDTVVATFVYCSVSDPIQALSEVRRVLKPDGRFLAVEHVYSRNPGIQFLLQAARIPLGMLAGCDPTRNTVANIGKAGLEVVQVDSIVGDVVIAIEARLPS